MKFIFTFLILIFAFACTSFAASQIILINAEPYLVDLNEEYDIEKVYHKVPDYFSNPETHEEILAHEVQELNRNSKLTSIDIDKAVRDIVDTEVEKQAGCMSICTYAKIVTTSLENSDLHHSADDYDIQFAEGKGNMLFIPRLKNNFKSAFLSRAHHYYVASEPKLAIFRQTKYIT